MPVFLVGGAVLAQEGLALFPRLPLLLQVFAGDKLLEFPLLLPKVPKLEVPAGLFNLVLVLLFHLRDDSAELELELVLLLLQFGFKKLSFQSDLLLDAASVLHNETLLVLNHRPQLADFSSQKLVFPFGLLDPGVGSMELILERMVDHLQRGVLLVGGVEGSVKLGIFPFVVLLNEDNFVNELFVLGVVLGVEGKDLVYLPVYLPQGCRPLLPLLRLLRGQHAPFRPPRTQHYLLILNYIPMPQKLLLSIHLLAPPFHPHLTHFVFAPRLRPTFFWGTLPVPILVCVFIPSRLPLLLTPFWAASFSLPRMAGNEVEHQFFKTGQKLLRRQVR